MFTVARFDSPEEAYLFRSFLASRGIGSAVLDEYVSQLFWNYRFATGGVRVVLENDMDAEQAEAMKEEYLSALSPQPTEEVIGWPVVALLSLVMGVPMPVFGRRPVERKDEVA